MKWNQRRLFILEWGLRLEKPFGLLCPSQQMIATHIGHSFDNYYYWCNRQQHTTYSSTRDRRTHETRHARSKHKIWFSFLNKCCTDSVPESSWLQSIFCELCVEYLDESHCDRALTFIGFAATHSISSEIRKVLINRRESINRVWEQSLSAVDKLIAEHFITTKCLRRSNCPSFSHSVLRSRFRCMGLCAQSALCIQLRLIFISCVKCYWNEPRLSADDTFVNRQTYRAREIKSENFTPRMKRAAKPMSSIRNMKQERGCVCECDESTKMRWMLWLLVNAKSGEGWRREKTNQDVSVLWILTQMQFIRCIVRTYGGCVRLLSSLTHTHIRHSSLSRCCSFSRDPFFVTFQLSQVRIATSVLPHWCDPLINAIFSSGMMLLLVIQLTLQCNNDAHAQ